MKFNFRTWFLKFSFWTLFSQVQFLNSIISSWIFELHFTNFNFWASIVKVQFLNLIPKVQFLNLTKPTLLSPLEIVIWFEMLPFLCCSTRYLIKSLTAPSPSNSLLKLPFDALTASNFPSSLKNDEEVVVVLEEAPITASSSDSTLLAINWEEEISLSTFVVMEEGGGVIWDGGAEGDCDRDFFERFSKVLTKKFLKWKNKEKKWDGNGVEWNGWQLP